MARNIALVLLTSLMARHATSAVLKPRANDTCPLSEPLPKAPDTTIAQIVTEPSLPPGDFQNIFISPKDITQTTRPGTVATSKHKRADWRPRELRLGRERWRGLQAHLQFMPGADEPTICRISDRWDIVRKGGDEAHKDPWIRNLAPPEVLGNYFPEVAPTFYAYAATAPKGSDENNYVHGYAVEVSPAFGMLATPQLKRASAPSGAPDSWADLTFSTWKSMKAAFGRPDETTLNLILRGDVIDQPSKDLMDDILRYMVRPVRNQPLSRAFFTPTQSNGEENLGFLALLSTPAFGEILEMLRDHAQELGRRQIKQIGYARFADLAAGGLPDEDGLTGPRYWVYAELEDWSGRESVVPDNLSVEDDKPFSGSVIPDDLGVD